MVVALVGAGYVLTSQVGADVTPLPGQVVIEAGIPVRQSDQVEYTFLEDTAVYKLELTSEYIEIDDEIRFGAHVDSAGHVNISLRFWDTDAISGRVLQWNASSADDVIATFTIYSPDFSTSLPYQVKVDGVAAAGLTFEASRTVSISWGVWSDHLFELLIPEAADDTDDTDDDSDTTPSGPPSLPIVEGLNPVAWLVVGLIASTVIMVAVLLLSRSRRNRGRSRS